MLTIVGQGLAGTLAGLEAERLGRDFRVIDLGSGASASRAAAGLFNPLTGPRFSVTGEAWDRLEPYYRTLEDRLGTALVHLLPLIRPLTGSKSGPESFPRSAPGWSASVERDAEGRLQVRIEGGGWVDLAALLDGARARWKASGQLEERGFTPNEGHGKRVLWCPGAPGLVGVWAPVVRNLWQPVRGDVLTVRIPGLALNHGEVGPRFLLPLGNGLFRWGATHEIDVDDQGYRPEAKALLEQELKARLGGAPFEVTGHAWGVRPASRDHRPLILPHPDEPGWQLFSGLGGRGVAQGPAALGRLSLF